MHHAILKLRGGLCGLLAFIFTASLVSAQSFTQGVTTPPPNVGTASMTINVAVVPTASPTAFDLVYSWTGTKTGTLGTNMEGRVDGTQVATINNFASSFSGNGTLTSRTGVQYQPGKYRFAVAFNAGSLLNEVYYVYPPGHQPCGDITYDYYLPGDSIMGTRYIVLQDPDDGEATIIWEGTVGFGATERVTGTLTNFCGNVRVQKFRTGQEIPWEDYTPLPGPPDAPPLPPSPPPPPNPPDEPPAPPNEGGGTTPPTPPTPPAPPIGGGGGDGEIIEWVKDTNEVNRGISTRTDISNEYLRQIRDNTEYAADRLKTIDEGTQVLADDVKRKQIQEQEIIDKTPSVEAQQAQGAAAGQAVLDAMGTLTAGDSSVTGTEPAPEFDYKLFGGFEVDLNPFKEDRAGPLAAFIKAIVAWFLVWKWFRWAMDKGFNAGTQAMIAPQARGNTVAAGTGGQATSLIAAVLITAITLSMIVVIVAALRDTSLGGFTMTGVLATNPFDGLSGIAGKIVWCMEQIFPISTLVACLWNYLTFNWVIQGVAWVAITLKRFIVP